MQGPLAPQALPLPEPTPLSAGSSHHTRPRLSWVSDGRSPSLTSGPDGLLVTRNCRRGCVDGPEGGTSLLVSPRAGLLAPTCPGRALAPLLWLFYSVWEQQS